MQVSGDAGTVALFVGEQAPSTTPVLHRGLAYMGPLTTTTTATSTGGFNAG